jgi:rhodanese-related sulfurtransferase
LIEKYSDLNIPIEKLELRLDEIDVTKTLILCCQKGIRSRKAVEILAKHNIKKAVSLANGIEEYFNYGKN